MSHFFAYISRMKFINRWALMRNTSAESLSTHSYDVAVIANALCVIGNERLGKSHNAERAAVIALYHDASEIITGDMPTPVKYFNTAIKSAYKDIEKAANDRLLGYLPNDMKKYYSDILSPSDEVLTRIVKAADKISACIKCAEEIKMGNSEFKNAFDANLASIKEMDIEEANIFISEFLESYSLPLDELK